MQKDLLLYLDFSGTGFFTLVGGVRTTSFTLAREPVETEEFEKHHRSLIAQSGVESLDVNGAGVFDSHFEMFKRLQDIVKSGMQVKGRLKSNEVHLEADFLIPEFSCDSETNDAKNFTIRLMSSGEVKNLL